MLVSVHNMLHFFEAFILYTGEFHYYIPILFDQTNTTFRFTNGEFTESAHSSVKTFESTHGCQKFGDTNTHAEKP